MKNFAKVIALIMVLILAFTGCGGGASDEERTDLVIASLNGSLSFLPWENNSTFDYYMLYSIYDPLMYSGGTFNEIEPRIAESYEVSEDGLTYTFTLRDDVTFHDGTAVTAEDVVATFEKYKASPYKSEYAAIAGATAIDSTTVEFKLDSYNPVSLYDIIELRIAPVSAYEADPDGFMASPIGSGAYKVVSYDTGVGASLTAYDGYYRGTADITDLRIDIITDATTLELAMKDGSVDMAIIGEATVANFTESDGVNIEFAPSDIFYELIMNCENEYLKDPAVRNAIAYAISTDVILENVLNGVGAVNSYAPISQSAYEWSEEVAGTHKQDIEKAKKLLADAGYTEPIDLGTVACRTDAVLEKMITVIQSDLAEIGINVELNVQDQGTTVSDLMSGNFDLTLMILSFYDSIYACPGIYEAENFGGGGNYCRYADEELAAILYEGYNTRDEAVRAEKSDAVIARVAELLPGMKVADKAVPVAYNSDLEVNMCINNWISVFDDIKWAE